MTMILKMTKGQKDSVERYRRIFPDSCEGKSDVEILLHRRLITESQAELMNTPKLRKKYVRRKSPVVIKKVRPYTYKQLVKLTKGVAQDVVADGICSLEDAAFDLARNLIDTDERVKAYFENTRIKKQHWVEALAEYFAD